MDEGLWDIKEAECFIKKFNTHVILYSEKNGGLFDLLIEV